MSPRKIAASRYACYGVLPSSEPVPDWFSCWTSQRPDNRGCFSPAAHSDPRIGEGGISADRSPFKKMVSGRR